MRRKKSIGSSLTLIAVCLFASCLDLSLRPTFGQSPSSKALAELKTASVAQRPALLKQLQNDQSIKLMDLMTAMAAVDPVLKNLYLGVAQSVLERNPKSSEADLKAIVAYKSLDAAARYWAFSVLSRGDEKGREAMLRTMLDDPALELRYEAVKLAQSEIKAMKESGTEPAKLKESYRKLLAAARLPEQVQQIADALKELEDPVDLLSHFGFISKWQLIASFDNRKNIGFNTEYDPEKLYIAKQAIDIDQEFEAKDKEAKWQPFETKEPDGSVDLNPIFKNEKGAVAYAYAEFDVGSAVDCEVRLGCINANKVWVNGVPAFSNEVYHTGAQIDQYTAPVKLKAGKNTVLVKVCQNEQTEQWAQDWKFQLRFSDASGLAIKPAK